MSAPGMYDLTRAADRARLLRIHAFHPDGTAAGLLGDTLVDDPAAAALALWWEGRSRLALALGRLADWVAP